VLQCSTRVSVLFAGSIEHLMRDLFAPTDRALSQFGGFHEFAPITPEQWTDGLRRRLALDHTTITDDALARLIDLGEGHPRATMLDFTAPLGQIAQATPTPTATAWKHFSRSPRRAQEARRIPILAPICVR